MPQTFQIFTHETWLEDNKNIVESGVKHHQTNNTPDSLNTEIASLDFEAIRFHYIIRYVKEKWQEVACFLLMEILFTAIKTIILILKYFDINTPPFFSIDLGKMNDFYMFSGMLNFWLTPSNGQR
jgi:hypothetical protein